MGRVTLLLILIISVISTHASSKSDDECVYTVFVRTGSVLKGGTDARIGLILGDAAGKQVEIADLESWGGLMGEGHDYFERGALDIFSGRGPCRENSASPFCSLNVTSNGAGAHHGWFCESVEVASTGPHVPCSQTLFYVKQWLANDAPPYQLYAAVDSCDQMTPADVSAGKGCSSPFVVGGGRDLSAASLASVV